MILQGGKGVESECLQVGAAVLFLLAAWPKRCWNVIAVRQLICLF